MSTISSRNRTRLPADSMRPFATSHRWQSFLDSSLTTGRVSDIGCDHVPGSSDTDEDGRKGWYHHRRNLLKVNPKADTGQAEQARETRP